MTRQSARSPRPSGNKSPATRALVTLSDADLEHVRTIMRVTHADSMSEAIRVAIRLLGERLQETGE